MVHKTAKVKDSKAWNEVFLYQVKDINSLVDFKLLEKGFLFGDFKYVGNTTIREFIKNAGKVTKYKLGYGVSIKIYTAWTPFQPYRALIQKEAQEVKR